MGDSMQSLAILVRTENSVLYEVLHDQPKLNERRASDEEKAAKVVQTGIKGACCWDNVFNFLGCRGPRKEIEEICSKRVQELTAYDAAFPVTIEELYSESDSLSLRRTSLKNAELFLQSEEASACDSEIEMQQGRSSITSYMKEFIKEKTHTNFHDFLIAKRCEKQIAVNMQFLSKFDTDVHKLTESSEWKKFDLECKAAVLDTYVRDFLADLYQLKRSTWKPSEEFGKLLIELKEKGPMMIFGEFGIKAYLDPPYKMKEKAGGRDIYAWSSGAKRTQSKYGHSVLLVGAKKTQDQAFVYFIDPTDSSGRSKKTIYMVSIKNLTEHICSLSGKMKLDSAVGYAYLGNFKIPV